MKRLLLLLPLIAVGCARVDVTTTLKADGSFDRTVVYTVTTAKNGMMPPGGNPEDTFAYPKNGPGLSVTRKEGENETVVTAVRSIAAGQTLSKDLGIVSGKKPLIENIASVKDQGDGTWAFTEKIHYVGEAPPQKMPDSELRAAIKKVLPPTADTATIDRTTRKTVGAVWRVLFGPSEPLFATMLLHPSLAERLFNSRVAAGIDEVLTSEGVPAEKRQAMIQDVAKMSSMKSFFDPQSEAKKQTENPSGPKSDGLVPIMMAVKVPGTVVQTNGQKDALTGEVYWAFYPESAAVDDLELKVVYKP